MGLEEAFELGQIGKDVRRIADVLTTAQHGVIETLPGLQQYWPGGIRTASGGLAEHAGGGTDIAEVGDCPTGFDGDAYTHVGNGTNYFTLSGGGGITGLETWISSSIRGLTVGAWVMADVQGGNDEGIITKDTSAPNRGYALLWKSTGAVGFFISGTGAAVSQAVSATAQLATWHFIVGRFTPSTEVAIIVNGEKTVNTTAIPAQVTVSTANIDLGRYLQSASQILSGKLRDVFVCASALTDAQLETVRLATQPNA
jgi:hypothetical protein